MHTPGTHAYGPHSDQFGELQLPPGHEQHALAILIHGGFWRHQYRLDLMHPLVDALTSRGVATWNIEYRRVGPSGGGYPTTLEDVAGAIDHITSFGHAWPAIAVIGHSAGGHLALWNASRRDPARTPDLTIGLAPVADVITANRNGVGVDATTNFFNGDYDDEPDRYERGQPQPDKFAGRVVLLHGDQDDSVPLEQSTNLRGHVARLEILRATDHFDVIDPTHLTGQIMFEEVDALTNL